MQNRIFHRVNLIWIVLVLATMLSLESRQAGIQAGTLNISSVFILAIACGKSWIIGQEFMGLRHAPTSFKTAFNIWITALFGLLAGIYWLGAR